MFISKPYRPYERKYDIVIVDEVDNMFIDQGTSPAMISQTCNIIHYRDILNIIYYNRYKSVDDLQKNLDMIFKQCAFFNDEEGYKKIQILKNAALASDRKIRNIDYIIEDNNVIIIDSNTGLKKPKTKWSQSIHEMVQIKEGLEPESNSVTYTAVTQHDFFNLYNKILGVTGTVGTEKDKNDLRRIYGVEIFKAPRHFIKEKIINYLNRPYGSGNIFELINQDININYNKGRPILVIMNNILSVDDFVSQSYFQNINTIKGIDPINDENSRNVAGEVKAITIATSAAGRGVDIKLSEQAKKNGGLHVIIPFLMPNQRALEQAAGRCGRQGQPGSCNIYVSEYDYYIISKPFDKKEHNLWIIQNELVNYLHTYNAFLFDGKGEFFIQQLEFPCNSSLENIFKISAYRISNEKIFDEDEEDEEKNKKKEKITDLLMHMIKMSWGLLFNELTGDSKCEDLNYCKTKFNTYLKELEIYIPKNIKNVNDELEHLKKLFNKFNWGDVLIIGAITIALIGLSVAFFPEALPSLAFGTIAITKDILTAMNNDEKINWGKIFVSFSRGCLDGLIASKLGPAGNIIGSVILNPVEEFLKAKIDGKDYDLKDCLNDAKSGLFEGVSAEIGGKLAKPFLKDFKNFVDWKLYNLNASNNEIISNFAKKISKNDTLMKDIHKTSEIISENLYSNRVNDIFEATDSAVVEFYNKMSQNNLILNSKIENRIFEDNKEDDDEKDEMTDLEKNISSEFFQEILLKLREKNKNKNISKGLKNLRRK